MNRINKTFIIGSGLFGFYRGYTTSKTQILNQHFRQPPDLNEDENLYCLVSGVVGALLYTYLFPLAIICEGNHLYYNINKYKDK